MDRRRFLLISLAVALARPRDAHAQQIGKVYRIVIVSAPMPVAELAEDPVLRLLFLESSQLGYAEGQNLVVERRSGAGRRPSYPELAREIVRLAPDVVFAGSGRLALALRAATTTIPT